MTTGQFLIAATKVIECRDHNRLYCEQCVEEIARELGIEAWDTEFCEANNLEDGLVELVMVRE